MNSSPTSQLSQAGVSIWLDDLSRDAIEKGELQHLISEYDVVGVTTNPTIFAAALKDAGTYQKQLHQLAKSGTSAEEAVFALTAKDVADACDVFSSIYESSGGFDGRVSIEVEPGLAHNTSATVTQGRELWERVDRPNAMIKVPATDAGLSAITELTGAGISVNVTLIFDVSRYKQVIDAYLDGIRMAAASGIDLKSIHSVASFFVSRVDTEVDARLQAIGTPEATGLLHRIAIANAQIAYQVFEERFSSDEFSSLAQRGANVQRPLWASTGVKDPSLPDTRYVDELVAERTVNTMPRKTLQAVSDHGRLPEEPIQRRFEDAKALMRKLDAVGVDWADVVRTLESEGVEKFNVSWGELLESVRSALEDAR